MTSYKEVHGDLFCDQRESTFSYPERNMCVSNLGLATALTVVLAVFTATYFSVYFHIYMITK